MLYSGCSRRGDRDEGAEERGRCRARVEASVVAMVMVMIGVRMVIFHGGAYAAGRGVGESVAKSARCSPHHLTTKNGLGLATERH